MYPTVVILLVETHRSMMDVYGISLSNAPELASPVASEARPATSGRFSLVVWPIHSTTDNEAGFQRSCALQSQGGQERGPEEVLLKAKENQVGTTSSG